MLLQKPEKWDPSRDKDWWLHEQRRSIPVRQQAPDEEPSPTPNRGVRLDVGVSGLRRMSVARPISPASRAAVRRTE